MTQYFLCGQFWCTIWHWLVLRGLFACTHNLTRAGPTCPLGLSSSVTATNFNLLSLHPYIWVDSWPVCTMLSSTA
jgi:hypothetical protein